MSYFHRIEEQLQEPHKMQLLCLPTVNRAKKTLHSRTRYPFLAFPSEEQGNQLDNTLIWLSSFFVPV